MELYYSDNYKNLDFKNIDEIKVKRRYGQKSLETTAILILAIYGAIKITSWFTQGYFTKLGELTAETSFKKYQNFKSKLANAIFENTNPIFGIQFDYNGRLVRIFFNSNNKESFKSQLDFTSDIYEKLIGFIDSNSNIKMLTITFQDSQITDLYYVDKNNDIFSIDK